MRTRSRTRSRKLAVDVVTRLRRRSLLKKPGLSELLDWAGYMQVAGGDLDDMKGLRAPQLLLKSVPDQKQGDEEFGVVAADEDA